MRIDKSKFREVLENFTFSLDDKNVDTLEEAILWFGKRIPIGNLYHDEIVFGNGKSGQDPNIFRVEYYRKGMEKTIIEGRFDLRLHSLKTIVLYNQNLVGYEHFSFDDFGNFGQIKNIASTDFTSFKRELTSLITLL